MSQEWPEFNGNTLNAQAFQANREGYAIGVLSLYLGGTNSLYKPIQWPVFPYPSTPLASVTSSSSSGTSGFLGKYSLRQLDSLAVQTIDVAGKSITPDLPSQQQSAGYTYTVPSAYLGFLSHQLVPGAGRAAKIDEILMQATVTGASGSIGSPLYTPPGITMSIFIETYLPAGFAGIDLFNVNNAMPGAGTVSSAGYELGASPGTYVGSLNLFDAPNPSPVGACPTPLFNTNYAFISRVPAQPFGSTQTNGYWGDTLLQNNAGIDIMGNSPGPNTNYLDPDQIRAAAYHPWATNATGQYVGTGAPSAGRNLKPTLCCEWDSSQDPLHTPVQEPQPGIQANID